MKPLTNKQIFLIMVVTLILGWGISEVFPLPLTKPHLVAARP